MAARSRSDLEARRDLLADDAKRRLGKFIDVRLSYWSFNNYKDCPQQFLLQVLRKPIAMVKQDNFYAIGGSVVHQLWETFVTGVRKSELDWKDSDFLHDKLTECYDDFVATQPIDWSTHKVTPDDHRTASLPELHDSLSYLYSQLEAEGLIPRDPSTIHTEVSFETKLTPYVTIAGRSDIVFESPEYIEIVDLKDVINRSNVSWRQLIWYTLGLEPVFNKPAKRAGFLLTKLHDWSWRNPNAKNYRDDLRTEILETAIKIRRDAFRARVSRHVCPRCRVQSICPEWTAYAGRTMEILNTVSLLEEGAMKI